MNVTPSRIFQVLSTTWIIVISVSCGLVLILIAICLIAFFCGMCCFKKPEPKRSTDVPDPPPPRQMTNNNYQRNQNYDNNTQVLMLEAFWVNLIYGFDIQKQGCKIFIRGRILLPSGSLTSFQREKLKNVKDKMEIKMKQRAYLSTSTCGILSEEQLAAHFSMIFKAI